MSVVHSVAKGPSQHSWILKEHVNTGLGIFVCIFLPPHIKNWVEQAWKQIVYIYKHWMGHNSASALFCTSGGKYTIPVHKKGKVAVRKMSHYIFLIIVS